jgi:hypothetical protein
MLYKNCSNCGRLKHHTRFASNGRDKSRRKSDCHECKNFKKIQSQHTFDTEILKKTSITVRFKINSKKRIFYRISYEDAVRMVEERIAGIVSEKMIHQLYSKEAFKTLILERDNFFCQYCGGEGNTIDHIIPISMGGISTFSNCVCACLVCNKLKGSLSLGEFLNAGNND